MAEIELDEKREERIDMEIMVDTYGAEEQAMGWCCYLDERISFPFTARCMAEKRISPLKLEEEVTVTGLAPEEDCKCEMFVEIEWAGRTLGVPLVQLEPLGVDSLTQEAVADWHYWVKRGYQFLGDE